ncbi:MAG: CopG family transcriptional regulator [Actinomycetota bacterium]|nr:CopG family transcriptional regulator [Actinomycetota bacterium]
MSKREGTETQVTLKIPRPLYEQLKQVISGSGFHSVTEFAVYVLRDLVSHHGGTGKGPIAPRQDEPASVDVDPLSPEEIEAIRQRLQSLGYL